ncbi:MAG: hypothetical protein HYX71_07500 [Opitutae bacterium]|nr:hypothetical protein [Opitutae bacterium]
MSLALRLRSAVSQGLRALGLYYPLRDARRDWRFARRSRAEVAAWEKAGRPTPPPPAIKHRVIRDHASRYQARTLVETGTFYGDTPFALRGVFAEMHSIELAPALHQLAVSEMGHLGHLHLHLGDSATLLPRIVPGLTGPVLYWLDGHFCTGPSARNDRDTPISTELSCLLARPAGQDVILIDDARLFTGRDGYPDLAELRDLIRRHRPAATCEVALDLIRIAPV